jgi:uncharacterized protein YdeI (YjbR/CyaY-like superfamily)
MDVRFFASAAAFRAWLDEHHASAAEVWVGFFKKQSGRGGITYAEALDEALCYGWIDGIRKRVDDDSYTNRFTPRTARSVWSAVNIKRAGELAAAGRMQPAGLAAFNARDERRSGQYSYEERQRPLDAPYEALFRSNLAAWDFFAAQPPSYRRTASWWVMSAKKEETRLRRLATLIGASEQGQRLAQVTGGATAQKGNAGTS